MKHAPYFVLFFMILTSILLACESGMDPALDGDLPASSDGDEIMDVPPLPTSPSPELLHGWVQEVPAML